MGLHHDDDAEADAGFAGGVGNEDGVVMVDTKWMLTTNTSINVSYDGNKETN
jgi:hypothetical protein